MKLELNDIRMDSESGIQIGHTHNAYTHVSQPVEGVQHAGWMKGYTALAAALVGFAMLGTGGVWRAALVGGHLESDHLSAKERYRAQNALVTKGDFHAQKRKLLS